MHQESGPAIDVGAQQAQPFVGGIPGFHHDKVEFVAQKIFHHAFVAWLDFQEIREHAGGSEASIQSARLEKPPNRFGRIAVLGDHRFQRSLFAERRRIFCTQAIQAMLGLNFRRRFASKDAGFG